MKTPWGGWFVGVGASLLLSAPTAAYAVTRTAVVRQQPTVKSAIPANPLKRRISLPALQAPLGMVLREVARRGGVALSYSPTRLPLDREVKLAAVRQQPLEEVLALILQGQAVEYGVVAGQVVLWRRDERPPAAVLVGRRPGRAGATARNSTSAAGLAGASKPAAPSRKGGAVRSLPAPVVAGRAPVAGPARARTAIASAPVASAAPPLVHDRPDADSTIVSVISTAPAVAATDSVTASGLPSAPSQGTSESAFTAAVLAERAARAARKVSGAATRAARQVGNGVSLLSSRIVGLVAPLPDSVGYTPPAPIAVAPQSESAWRQRGIQVSLVPPLSTNGSANARTVNKISLNLLAGYAAGVRGVEVGGLFNIVRDSIVGLQLGGIANRAGGPVIGAQVAGVWNTAVGGLEGIQSAGLVNISKGLSAGWQSAGLLNIANSRLLPGQVPPDRAPEPLVQFAGLFNSAPHGLRGGQVAGLLNIAGRVKGVQIAGLLNIADTVAGVSLAPLNFVRRGYHALELSTDGVWPVALTLKLGGSAAFYTYFTAVTDGGFANPTRWGLGYGIGSELAARQRLSFSIDGQVVQFKDNSQSWHMWSDGLNMHAQLRPQVGWGFGKKRRLRLVAGPMLNVFITEHLAAADGLAASNLDTSGITIFSEAGKANTRTSGWISAAAGLRWRF